MSWSECTCSAGLSIKGGKNDKIPGKIYILMETKTLKMIYSIQKKRPSRQGNMVVAVIFQVVRF